MSLLLSEQEMIGNRPSMILEFLGQMQTFTQVTSAVLQLAVLFAYFLITPRSNYFQVIIKYMAGHSGVTKVLF